ncbi:MAG: pyridoxamine 5'-phosphate oxidase family protein [Candidatus Bipolaricaulis sp.]|nr:pyridoxamine 5'-phosphate oxidase family protein [Candidatus Bipolaricaulis sp.]
MPNTLPEIQEEVWRRLKPSQCVYLATAEAEQPRVRPVTLLNIDQKFWIATSTRSAKARQMRRNPNVEFCLPLDAECGNGYLRIAGLAAPVTDPSTREAIGKEIPFLREFWTGSDDPQFALFRITRVEIEYLRPGELTAFAFLV